ncbi:MAG: hypothetical protein AB7N91_31080 [Candidatus Tectimicrobiota bacterium]
MQLDYLQREGAELGHERGQLDGPRELAQADTFLDRTTCDRHHFQFVVSPERGADLNLTAFTRGLLSRMEADLDTRLDWVAVTHHDTAHPHTHVVTRGIDEDAHPLHMRNDYLRDGIRFQAQDLATRELGWQNELTREPALRHAYTLSRESEIGREHTLSRGLKSGWDDDRDLASKRRQRLPPLRIHARAEMHRRLARPQP